MAPPCFARTLLPTLLVSSLLVAFGIPGHAAEPAIEQLILAAGNADDDAERLEILKRLQAWPDLEDSLRRDVGRIVELVERWTSDPRLFQWFHKEIRENLDYDMGIERDSPLYPLTAIYRGRMLVWTANEDGNILGYVLKDAVHPTRRGYDIWAETMNPLLAEMMEK